MRTRIRCLTTLSSAVITALLAGLGLLTPADAAETPAALNWSLARYDFGSVPVGQTPSQTFTLSNTGATSSGTITVRLSGSPAFTITADACTGRALGANKSCSVTVQYPTINTNGDTGTLAATGERSSASMALYGNGSANLVPSRADYIGRTSPIQGAVVGHYFGFFDKISKERYKSIVASAPFDKCNLLILAFVRTFEFVRPTKDGGTIYVAQLANGHRITIRWIQTTRTAIG
jgi:hypothetical protein